MPNTIYDNFFLTNEIADQYDSHLDLQQFCTVDNNLVGEPGMIRKINVYTATSATEDLEKGEGNTGAITVSYTPQSYTIKTAQNKFEYYDEEEKTDPTAVLTGIQKSGIDLYNHVMGDVYDEFKKATLEVEADAPDFNAFVDAFALLNAENLEDLDIFAICNPKDIAKIRKALNEDLKYVEAFAKNGYVGSVAGINIYAKKNATEGVICVATKEAVKLFNKSGVEVEDYRKGNRSAEDADVRKNTILSRKYYLAALVDATKAVKITLPGASV